jgi:TP901 family phage tail tape measure protein
MPIKVPVVQTGLEKSIQLAAQKAGKNLKINMGPGAKSIDSLSQPLGKLTGKTDDFSKSMAAANARVLAFGASVGVIAAVSRGMKELVGTTIEVEKSLANINSILKQSESQLDSFKKNIFDIARNTEQSFASVAEAALELSRQGLKAEQVTQRLNDALILSRLSGMNAADSVAGLTAAINSFKSSGLTSAQVLNKISAAAASAAVSDRDLIEGLKRSGSVAVSTGVDFDKLVGIIGALQEKTARGGAVIGNSLKTIFTRIQDVDKLTSIQKLGVQITDLQGQILSADKVIENLAPTFAKLDQSSKVNLADNLVGKFQIAPFLSLLEQYNEEIVRSNEIAKTSFNSSTEAYERNEALNNTLSAAVNTATLNLKELANTLGEIGVTDNMKSILSFFNSIVSGIQGVLDGEGMGSKLAKGLVSGIGNVLSGPGLALALAVIGKVLIDFGIFGAKSLKVFFGLNKAAERQAKLQGQIASSLLTDQSIRKKILDIENLSVSAEQKKVLQAQFFTTALNEQLALMTKMQTISMGIAPIVSKGTSGGRGRRAADGFLPVGAEKSDISRGVGGAPSSAKPVVIPNFAFGGGKRGTMVANSSEYIVPNYANGGDAIFNQNMASSMGLPANAKKVRAASGYVPNFAKLSNLSATGNLRDDIRILQNTNAKGQFQQGFGSLTALQANKVLSKARNRRTKKPQAGINTSVVSVPASRYGVASVFPAKKTDNSSTNPSQLNSPLAKAAASQGIKNIRFEGIQIGSIHNVKQDLKKKKNQFKNKLAKLFANPVAQLGSNLIGSPFQKNDAQDLKQAVKEVQRGGGGVDLFSSSVEGGIFESAIRLITNKAKGIRAFKNEKDDQRPFDFEEGEGKPNQAFKKTFGFNDGLLMADGKRTASAEAVRTVISKAFNSKSQRAFLTRQIRKTNPSFDPNLLVKKAATGYIPNFAGGALEEAVGREKAAGLPVSQIRINQSGKLRNSQNPQGLAVTNTRDEPTGRIPNLAKRSKKSEDDASSGLGALGMKSMMAVSALSILQGMLGQTTDAQSKANESLFKFSDALDLAMKLMMVNMVTSMIPKGGGLMTRGASLVKTGQIQSIAGAGSGGAMGALMKGGGGLLRVFGSLTKIVGRFIPFIGPLIMAFTALTFFMKKFGVDFKGVGAMIGNGFKKAVNLLIDGASMVFNVFSFGTKKILELIAKIPGLGDVADAGLSGIDSISSTIQGAKMETTTFSDSLSQAQKSSAERKAAKESQDPAALAAKEKEKEELKAIAQI